MISELLPPSEEQSALQGLQKKLPVHGKKTAAVTNLHLVAAGDLDICNHLVKMFHNVQASFRQTVNCNLLFSTVHA